MPKGDKRLKGTPLGDTAQTLFNRISSVVVLLDPAWKVTFLNQFGGERLGWSFQEAVGKSWLEHFVPPESRPTHREILQGVCEGKGAKSWETEVLCNGGARRRLAWTFSPLTDSSGAILGILGHGVDRTQEYLYREALRRRERFLAAVLDTADEAIITSDLEGHILSWNRGAERLLGYTAGEAIGQHFDLVLPPELRGGAYLADLNQRTKEEGIIRDHVSERLTRDGRRILARISRQTLLDDQGRVVGFTGTIRDITESKRAEEALRQEKDRARKYLDIAEVILVALNDQGEVTLINQKGCKTLGYGEKEILGKNWFEAFLPPGIREETWAVFQSLMAGEVGPAEYYENPILTKSGEQKLISWHNTILRDEAGKITGTLSSGEDITERRGSEEMVREKETLIRTALDNMVDGFITIDEEGVIETFNQAAERMFGYSAEEVIGQNVQMLMPEPFRSEHDGYIRNYLETGEAKIIGIGREVPGVRKDGSAFPLSIAVSEMRLGHRRMFIANLRDISKERELESAFESRNRLMAAIVDSSADAIISFDAEGHILSWNSGAEAIFGYSAEEVLGEHYRFMIPPDLAKEEEEEQLERMFREQGYIRNYLTRRQRENGQEVQVMITRTAMRNDEGEIIGYSSILRDVTEENRLREQLYQSEKFAAIGELAAGIAHEVGGPLSVISGNAEFLKEGLGAEDPRKEDVEAIVRECDAVAGLVRRLLDFSKPARLEAKPVDVNGCLRNVLFLVQKQVAKGKIEMKLDLQVGLPPVLGDANQLEQVFLNLLMNAWHAMPGGGELRIRSFVSRGENPTIGVEVTDTGVGIPEANLGRIFDPFFTTRPPGKGTGLGLAITRRIVTDHGGTISVRSREGKGTTFVVELPAAKEASE